MVQLKPFLRSVSLKREKIEKPDDYPFSIPCVRALDKIEFHPDITFLVGENGTGKSTLLEAIAIAWGFNAEGGTKNFNFATRPSHSELHEYIRMVRSPKLPTDGFFLRAESFFNVATQVDELGMRRAYGGKSLHEQSHGESFLSLMLYRFGGHGLYILDEPEAAVSPMRQLAMLRCIHQLIGAYSQFIIATHSPILLAYPGAKILTLNDSGFTDTPYEETEHYTVTRRFLNGHKPFLENLLAPDEDESEDERKRRAR
jgi:predicted ATPase